MLDSDILSNTTQMMTHTEKKNNGLLSLNTLEICTVSAGCRSSVAPLNLFGIFTFLCKTTVLHHTFRIEGAKYVGADDKNILVKTMPLSDVAKNKTKMKMHARNNFKNVLTLWVSDSGKRTLNVRIFSTGSVHVAGARSLDQAYACLEDFVFGSILESALRIDVSCLQKAIYMVNGNIQTHVRIDREEACRCWNSTPRLRSMGRALFNPDRHAAMKVRLEDTSTSLLFFRTGAVVVAGKLSDEQSIDIVRHYIFDFLLCFALAVGHVEMPK